MPWSHPAARMREFVLAMRAIWATWNNGTKLDFRGDFYPHTLMTPFFAPDRHVGPRRSSSPRSAADDRGRRRGGRRPPRPPLHDRALPAGGHAARARGGPKAGRSRADFEISWRLIVVTGTDEEEVATAAQARAAADRVLRLDAGVPAVLDLHGWGDLQQELNRLSKQGEWVTMASSSPTTCSTRSRWSPSPTVATQLVERYKGALDRLSSTRPYCSDPERWSATIQMLQKA